jgi:hypothetical protein
MAQHNISSDHFDLLPFIAILMCLLGTLLFITMSVAAINIGPGAGEGWVPAATVNDTAKTPLLVEWDGETVIIQYSTGFKRISIGQKVRSWFNSDGNFKSREMLNFLSEMKSQNSTTYVLFAVRPSGFENFQTLAAEFRSKGIDIGYEPIEQGKSVRIEIPSKGQP